MQDLKALVAEFIGTFALIFLGAGAVTLVNAGVGGSLVTIALAHGLTIMIFAYAFGDVSGSHINPAVTIGLYIGGALDGRKVVPYIVAQLLGAILAGFVLSGIWGNLGGNLGATLVNLNVITLPLGFLLEMIGTFFLVNTIMNAAVAGKAGHMAPVAIGMTVAACILMFGPLTGASLNPARTLGPAVAGMVTGQYNQLLQLGLFIVSTILGGALAGAFNRYFMQVPAEAT